VKRTAISRGESSGSSSASSMIRDYTPPTTGVDVIGVTDHGFVQTIYFFDPNGLRLELSARTCDAAAEQEAHTAVRE
jgi:hypothetical protein